jgi:hypothetical protein
VAMITHLTQSGSVQRASKRCECGLRHSLVLLQRVFEACVRFSVARARLRGKLFCVRWQGRNDNRRT